MPLPACTPVQTSAYQRIVVPYFRTDEVPCVNDDEPCLPDASDNVTNSWVCISMFWGIGFGEFAR